MEHMTVGDIVRACSGALLQGNEETAVTGISINSREVTKQDLFVPLIGEKTDAHKYIGQALNQGAAAVLTSEHTSAPAGVCGAWISVPDTKKALQDIGSYYRNRLSLQLVGVTGSVGKTTTREMIAAALSAGFRVYKTLGNHNSQVGVPITLTEIGEKDQIGVIELGMSEPGELTVIARIAQVDMAVITNIGIAHIEQLGSQENICREKMTIQDGLKPGGTLFLNGDDPWLKNRTAKEGCRTVYYGTGENSQYRAEEIHMADGYPVFTAVHGEKRVPVRLQVPGAHQILNAMSALAVADSNGVPMEEAVKALETFRGFKGRQQIYRLKDITVIDDTYNASPVSMRGAIDVLASMKDVSRKIAVLADMKELGSETVRFHREVGAYVGKQRADLLVTYGGLAKEMETGAKEENPALQMVHFEEKESLEAWLLKELKSGDCVLFKGSNSMKLGEVAEHVCQHHH